jgi:phospholipase A-2-activating protein
MHSLSQQLVGHSGDVRCVAVLGSIIVTGGLDATCIVWRSDSNKVWSLYKQIHGHSDAIYAICPFGPNSTWFISSGKDREIFVFDSESGEKKMEFQAHASGGPISSLAVGRKNILAAGSWDGSVSLFNVDTGELVDRIENAGAYAVTVAWAGEILVTGSQDKSLKWWDGSTMVHEIKNAHDDIIRSIRVSPGNVILTASNDGLVKMWSMDGQCLGQAAGHSNFVFSVYNNGPRFVSAGEDRKIILWDSHRTDSDNVSIDLVESIDHPGTVWFGVLPDDSTIISGCADGILRVFSNDPSRMAPPEELEIFNSLCAEAEIKATQQSSVDPATVPLESAMFRYAGRKTGEIKMFKNDKNEIFAYQWAGAGWEKVGLVTGSSGGKKSYPGDQFFPAGEYDYVFDVELGDGASKALLPVNNDDNPLVVAEKFCAKELINKSHVSQIMDFLKQNMQQNHRSTLDSSPPPISSNHIPPPLGPFLFRDAKWTALKTKLFQVIDSVPGVMSDTERNLLSRVVDGLQNTPVDPNLVAHPEAISVVFAKLILVAESVPSDAFVVFDLWRLVVLHNVITAVMFNGPGGNRFILPAVRMIAKSHPNTTLCAMRYIANLFSTSVGKWAVFENWKAVVDTVREVAKNEGIPRPLQLACITVFTNLAIAANEKKSTDVGIAVAEVLVQLTVDGDDEVVYRYSVGLGCTVLAVPRDNPIRTRIGEILVRIPTSSERVVACIAELTQRL